ncbi:peptidoglycan-binding protein [Streptomyces venezuelae]|uniref:Peptidoglycan-binding protein n=1 Tax=Streptomyces venezuelae TaxID=54571 RepID=A0A5P2CWQ2_STRVZ|nr:LysM peptidoglycan-binding domain-containing protein [Streptomyces venezuelae]QES46863.1 peptidoglycan-binding protein [Streptomyces venezuelae]
MAGKGKHRRPKNNPLTRGFLFAGTGGAALVLPLVGATGAQAAAPAAVPAAVPAAAPVKAPGTYSVATGDSLSKIAAKYGVAGGWKKLYEDNRAVIGNDPSLIRPGIKLTLNGDGGRPAAEPARAAAEPARADRSTRTPLYANNLDGWIKESLAIMAEKGIPGTYQGLYKNIMRESSGNPRAINNWDINAKNGIPSKGLLQVIDPTFKAYHVPGTSFDSYDPVANITAAANYAAARYGSIDNVNGPY